MASKAPAFNLKTETGETFKLADTKKDEFVVLYFYPKDNTSGCAAQACAFQENLGQFKKLGAKVIGVSPDNAVSHGKFKDKFKLQFPLLVDDGAKVAEKFGAYGEKSMYGRKYMGIIRSTFIIDSKGQIQAEWRKVKVPGHIDEVLEALKALKNGDAPTEKPTKKATKKKSAKTKK